jgi:L-amino acid N-acyltransferase YncA
VNDLYAKWVESSFERNEPIVVVENEGIVRGYFIIFFDENLSSSLGFKYGRMRSLALSAEVRGKGLGKNLFLGAINLMKKNGVGYIDSGYSTKNYLSAKLHTLNNFYSVYEEITLHKWL